jgi:hypothetical protein
MSTEIAIASALLADVRVPLKEKSKCVETRFSLVVGAGRAIMRSMLA